MDFRREEIPFPRYGSLTPEGSESIAHLSANEVENMEPVRVSEGRLMKSFGCIFSARLENAVGQILVRDVIPLSQSGDVILIVNELTILRDPQVKVLEVVDLEEQDMHKRNLYEVTVEVAGDEMERDYSEWLLRFCRFAFVRRVRNQNIMHNGFITKVVSRENPQPDTARVVLEVRVTSRKAVQYSAEDKIICIDATFFYRANYRKKDDAPTMLGGGFCFCPAGVTWHSFPNGAVFSDTVTLGRIIKTDNSSLLVQRTERTALPGEVKTFVNKQRITPIRHGTCRLWLCVLKEHGEIVREIFDNIFSFNIRRGGGEEIRYEVLSVERNENRSTIDYYYTLDKAVGATTNFTIESYAFREAAPRILKFSPSGFLYGIGLGNFQESNFGADGYGDKVRCRIVRSPSPKDAYFTDVEGKRIFLDLAPHIDVDDVLLDVDFLGSDKVIFFFTKKILVYQESTDAQKVHDIGTIRDVISDGLIHPKMHFRRKNEVYFFSESGLKKITQGILSSTIDVQDIEISNTAFLKKVPRVHDISTLEDYEAFIGVQLVAMPELEAVILKVRNEFFFISLKSDQIFLSKMRVDEVLDEKTVLFKGGRSLFLVRGATFYKYGVEEEELMRGSKPYPAVGKIVYVVQFKAVWRNSYIEPNFIFLFGRERVRDFSLTIENLETFNSTEVSRAEIWANGRIPCRFSGRKFKFTVQYSRNSDISYKSMTLFGNYQASDRRS